MGVVTVPIFTTFIPDSVRAFTTCFEKLSEVARASFPTTAVSIFFFLRITAKPLAMKYTDESLSSSSASRPRRSYSRNIVVLSFGIRYQYVSVTVTHLTIICQYGGSDQLVTCLFLGQSPSQIVFYKHF